MLTAREMDRELTDESGTYRLGEVEEGGWTDVEEKRERGEENDEDTLCSLMSDCRTNTLAPAPESQVSQTRF